jgi:hypothetical protein
MTPPFVGFCLLACSGGCGTTDGWAPADVGGLRGGCSLLRFGYLGKWSPCAYESLSTKGEDYYPCTLLYDSNFTLT